MLTVTEARESALLVSLESLKAELGITTDTDDEFLTSVLARSSSIAEAYCGRVFAVEGVSQVWRDVSRPTLLLGRWPVVEIESIEVDGVVLEADEYECEAGTGRVWRLNADARIAWFAEKITVAYTAGFSTLPGGVEEAILKMAKGARAARTRDPSLRSENILEGLYGYTLFLPSDREGGLEPGVGALLDPYRDPQMA